MFAAHLKIQRNFETKYTIKTAQANDHFHKKNVISVRSTDNDRYSGNGYSGIDRYSGTSPPDDAILFTVSGITAMVEQKFLFFRKF